MKTKLLALNLTSLALTALAAETVPPKTCSGAPAARAAALSYPPKLSGARVETYKTVGYVELKLWVFAAKDHSPTNRLPAIVFFFGGGWASGSPEQFAEQCRYLARRGMVAITADYRVASRHQAKPVQCVADARSAIRWVRAHAGQLGVDPNRIAASGGSAGGHLAACTALIREFDEKNEDAGVSASPNALVLFNPALVLAPIEGLSLEGFGSRVPAERLGTEPARISPAHHIKPDAPPTIIFHGRADTTVPFATAEAFAAAMKKAGNRCELVGFPGQKHGFFNFGREGNEYFYRTLRATDEFLTSLGWLQGPPTLSKP